MNEPTQPDVRMRGFSRRSTVEQARQWVDQQVRPLPAENCPLDQLPGRVLADEVRSAINVPAFDRSMMDGFAVVAADTAGAGSYQPLPLAIVGESLPAQPFAGKLQAGEAVRIMTGAPMPLGADAVVPVEKVEFDSGTVTILETIAVEKNVARIGEDIREDELVLRPGRRLRPQDVGLIASIGCGQAAVVRRPRVRVIVTGNELLPAGERPRAHQIVDSNSPMLRALVERDGGTVGNPGPVPDDPAALLQAFSDEADVFLVSGGSSVGQEDHAPQLIAAHGELAIHGIAMRPSSPAGMGKIHEKLVFLLPGNPVSCLCAYDFFAGRAIRVLGGRRPEWPYTIVTGRLTRKLVSVVGRMDYARVQIAEATSVDSNEPLAIEPLAIRGASILSSTTRADGFVVIAADSEGFAASAEVSVFLYDEPTAIPQRH